MKKALSALFLLVAASLGCTFSRPAPEAAPTLSASPTSTPSYTPTPVETAALPPDHTAKELGVTYCAAGDTALLADVYFAQNVTGPAPLLLFLHGGGWTGGSRFGGMGFEFLPTITAAGYTVASLDYRLAPQYKMPAMIEDVKCAVRSFRAHAAEWGIDPDRIGVIGASAGAHLAALMGTADESAGFDAGEYAGYSSRVQAVVDLAGPAILTDPNASYAIELARQVFGVEDSSDPRLAAASPVTWVSPDDPPFLIIHGEDDSTVPLEQSQILYKALLAAGVEAQLIVVKNAGHTLDAPDQSPGRTELGAAILQFLQMNLK